MKRIYCSVLVTLLMVSTMTAVAQNTLSAKEKKEGWQLLFDGKTTENWKSWKSDKVEDRWKVANGELYLDKSVEKGGDLMTIKQYKDYELALEWKISECGNSGIIFNVVEDEKYKATYFTGPEMQILDNTCHPDAKIHKHRAGDLYDLIPCTKETVKPAGEWNKVRIISKNSKLEFWLNDTKVVSTTMHDAKWDEMVANSKFKTMPDFGKALQGHIALQDHGDPVWFRNIKIRELK